MKWALRVRKCAPAIAIYNLYRPINLRAENQISQLHSRQISAPGDTQITIIGYALNFDWLRMWCVYTQQRKSKLNENTPNRLVNITLASSSCFSSFVVFLLACVRDLFNSLYCSAKRQCCNVVKNTLSCALFDNHFPPCPCISCSSYFLNDFVYKI